MCVYRRIYPYALPIWPVYAHSYNGFRTMHTLPIYVKHIHPLCGYLHTFYLGHSFYSLSRIVVSEGICPRTPYAPAHGARVQTV